LQNACNPSNAGIATLKLHCRCCRDSHLGFTRVPILSSVKRAQDAGLRTSHGGVAVSPDRRSEPCHSPARQPERVGAARVGRRRRQPEALRLGRGRSKGEELLKGACNSQPKSACSIEKHAKSYVRRTDVYTRRRQRTQRDIMLPAGRGVDEGQLLRQHCGDLGLQGGSRSSCLNSLRRAFPPLRGLRARTLLCCSQA
jgi:hypothetical protein